MAGALGVRLSQEQREKERVQRKELQMARGERKKWVTVWGAVFHWRSLLHFNLSKTIDQKRSGELKLLQ